LGIWRVTLISATTTTAAARPHLQQRSGEFDAPEIDAPARTQFPLSPIGDARQRLAAIFKASECAPAAARARPRGNFPAARPKAIG
jgi:hypothetical protein